MTVSTRRELLQPRAWLRAAAAFDAPAPVDATPPAAPTAERFVGDDELGALISRHGLASRLDDLRPLALPSARLVADDEGSTWVARIIESADAHREDGLLVACALDLAQLALPPAFVQLSFDDAPLRHGGQTLVDCGIASVRPVQRGAALAMPGGLRMSARPERTLPRVWSAAVQALDLSADEAERYSALRAALADAQGAVLFDTWRASSAFDRLLGHPDETTGLMPERCGGAPEDWRLLAQLTVSGWRGLGWRAKPQRLFCWITEAALASGTCDGVRVFAR